MANECERKKFLVLLGVFFFRLGLRPRRSSVEGVEQIEKHGSEVAESRFYGT